MAVYYNENDPFAAQWLRNLIAGGLIAPGDVDDRSIADVASDDVRGYAQCHFFAGIGIWSHALRAAGWEDDRPVWTGSCPCQPFSGAGKGEGFADKRHLWPVWFRLIRECRPPTLVGEQVEGPAGRAWLDLVHADLEGADYAFGAAVLCSAGVGAPNIRHRLYWVADSDGSDEQAQRKGEDRSPNTRAFARGQQSRVGGHCESGRLADAAGRDAGAAWIQRSGQYGFSAQDGDAADGTRAAERNTPHGRLADAEGGGCGEHGVQREADRIRQDTGQPALGHETAGGRLGDSNAVRRPGITREKAAQRIDIPSGPFDPWRDPEWIDCRDGKKRPAQSPFLGVAPGDTAGVERMRAEFFPLAPRRPGDVGRLRGYGNAINAVVAREFIAAFLDLAP